MHAFEYIYLGVIIAGMCCLYTALFFFSQYIYKSTIRGFRKKSYLSILTLIGLNLCIYAVSFLVISDKGLSNRFLHAAGGGMMVFIVCLMVIQDVRISFSRPVFFFVGFVLMTVLGLCNEVAEIVIQNHTGIVFAASLTDTLLDLASNTVGYILASLCLMRSIPIAYPLDQKHSVVLR